MNLGLFTLLTASFVLKLLSLVELLKALIKRRVINWLCVVHSFFLCGYVFYYLVYCLIVVVCQKA